MIKRAILMVGGLFIAFLLFQYFYTGSPHDIPPKTGFEVVAHRGVHQNFQRDTVDPLTGCEAQHISEPPHEYIENTLEAIEAAFSFGATIVEIDIKLSSDNQLVIFHDDMLECRTDGTGVVSDHPLSYLQKLDVGYGYTPDNGTTYPLRGKGIGKMPTLIEVLHTFPDKKFLIDHKDGAMVSAQLLAETLKDLPTEQQSLLYYWGTEKTYQYLHSKVPSVTRLFCNRSQMKQWILPYLLTAGIADIPPESKGYVMALTPQYTHFVWGWPYRFLGKVSDAEAKFYLFVDTEEDAQSFLDIPVDGIVTDRIDLVGKYYIK
ncbi:MAG: hypothetical protein JXB07_17460 [Anaerolineae bacterium]|nr:hypothetical protein [Anaerolineae bacterium]